MIACSECGQPAGHNARTRPDGTTVCISCWGRATTAAQVAQHDGTLEQWLRIVQLGDLLATNRAVSRPT